MFCKFTKIIVRSFVSKSDHQPWHKVNVVDIYIYYNTKYDAGNENFIIIIIIVIPIRNTTDITADRNEIND